MWLSTFVFFSVFSYLYVQWQRQQLRKIEIFRLPIKKKRYLLVSLSFSHLSLTIWKLFVLLVKTQQYKPSLPGCLVPPSREKQSAGSLIAISGEGGFSHLVFRMDLYKLFTYWRNQLSGSDMPGKHLTYIFTFFDCISY